MRLQTARVPEIGLKVAGKPANSRLNPRIDSNQPHQHIRKWLKQTFPSFSRSSHSRRRDGHTPQPTWRRPTQSLRARTHHRYPFPSPSSCLALGRTRLPRFDAVPETGNIDHLHAAPRSGPRQRTATATTPGICSTPGEPEPSTEHTPACLPGPRAKLAGALPKP